MIVEAPSGLLIPDNALDATGEYLSPDVAARHSMLASAIRRELKAVDSRLDLIFVKPGSRAFPKSPRFYFVRHNEQTADSFWVIEDEHGNYSEPTFAHLERLRQFDTAARNVWADFEKSRDDRKARAEKAREELRREFREKLSERLDFIYDGPGIHVTGEHKEKLGGSSD